VRLTQRLLLGAFLLVASLTALLVVMVDRQLGSRLNDDATAFLSREAQLIGELWRTAEEPADALADRVGGALGRRVTLIGADGVVRGDSEFDGPALARLQNHALRPEVAEALDGRLGTARRPSPSTGRDELYVATPVPPLGVARVSQPTARLDAVVSAARREVLTGAALALVAALLVAFLFSRAVSRPVEDLRDVTRALAAGDLARRPSLDAPGELGELAVAVRTLAEQLSARLNALEADDALLLQLIESRNEAVIAVDTARNVVRMNETARRLLDVHEPLPFRVDLLPRDVALRDALFAAFGGEVTEGAEVVIGGRTLNVTARPLADGGAVLALLDLTRIRRLEAVRRDFVANVSHELRTPLTVIGGFAETLQAEDVPLEDRRRFAERILSNTHRMQRIVDDLLDLSRIESGGWVPAPEPIALEALAEEIFSSARDAAAPKGLELATELAPGAELVFADATALRQILGNLVDNAVRHTAKGRVVLFAEREAGGVRVGVRDTGEGIPAAHLPRVFERFYRVDPGRSREQGGTGLGLAIVKHLVEAHGGHVRAESALGAGTTIVASFPAPRG